MLPVPPRLPETWPYAARPALSPLEAQIDVKLPGLGSGWKLQATVPLAQVEGEALGLSGAFGRGGVRRVGDFILRPYRRGGLVRHLNDRRYPDPSRFERELAVHRALWEAGFPTVEPVGFAWRPCPIWGVEGVLLTRFVPGSAWPRDWSCSAEVIACLGPALRALSAWGLWAPDLNATNVHVPLEGHPLLLDWDRAAWAAPGALLPKYHARLQRSLEKLEAPEAVRESLHQALC